MTYKAKRTDNRLRLDVLIRLFKRTSEIMSQSEAERGQFFTGVHETFVNLKCSYFIKTVT